MDCCSLLLLCAFRCEIRVCSCGSRNRVTFVMKHRVRDLVYFEHDWPSGLVFFTRASAVLYRLKTLEKNVNRPKKTEEERFELIIGSDGGRDLYRENTHYLGSGLRLGGSSRPKHVVHVRATDLQLKLAREYGGKRKNPPTLPRSTVYACARR